VYLLDDPLAAVDVHVARHLYTECIVGLLRHTTRVLVTHHVHFLQAADFIIVVEGGRIREIGQYLVDCIPPDNPCFVSRGAKLRYRSCICMLLAEA